MSAALCPVCGSELVTSDQCRACHTPSTSFPWPRSLPPDADELEYELDGMEPRDRALATQALNDEGIAYRWEPGPVLVVAADEEERVDEILDEATSIDVDDVETAPADDEDVASDELAMEGLSQVYDAADRLARAPDNEHAAQALEQATAIVVEHEPPWGFEASVWQRIGESATELLALIRDEDGTLGDIIVEAETLREMVRPHV
ncbi:MAG TPA: TFIIB-type zinc finger domain-containing protein [Acidimicrobiia bacterium]